MHETGQRSFPAPLQQQPRTVDATKDVPAQLLLSTTRSLRHGEERNKSFGPSRPGVYELCQGQDQMYPTSRQRWLREVSLPISLPQPRNPRVIASTSALGFKRCGVGCRMRADRQSPKHWMSTHVSLARQVPSPQKILRPFQRIPSAHWHQRSAGGPVWPGYNNGNNGNR